MFPIICGRSCSFDEILAVSGAGAFTFCYVDPYLYVTDQGTSFNGVLKIYDVSNSSSPLLLSTTSCEAGSCPQHPVVSGDILIVPYRETKKLAFWNVSDRANPVLYNALDVSATGGASGKPWAVSYIGTNACVVFGGVPTVDAAKVSFSNPSSPSVVDTFKRDLVDHDTICTMSYGSTFFMGGVRGGSGLTYFLGVDASSFNETSMVTGNLSEGCGKFVITNDGNYAYVVLRNGNLLWTLNVSNPNAISVSSTVTMTQTGLSSSTLQAITVVEELDRVYVGRGNGLGLLIPIMDITTRSTPTPSGSISTSGETVTDMCRIATGCPAMAWGQGTGAAIHLLGEAPLS